MSNLDRNRSFGYEARVKRAGAAEVDQGLRACGAGPQPVPRLLAVMGLSLSSLLIVFTGASVARVFFITAAVPTPVCLLPY